MVVNMSGKARTSYCRPSNEGSYEQLKQTQANIRIPYITGKLEQTISNNDLNRVKPAKPPNVVS